MGKSVWKNLKKGLQMGALAGGLILPLTSKAGDDIRIVDNAGGSVGNSNMRCAHISGAQEGADVYDGLWSDMPGNPNSQWLKIYTAPYGQDLNGDFRPTNSLTKFQIKGSVVDGDGTGVTSTNYITFNFLTTDSNRNYRATFNMPSPYCKTGQPFNWSGIVTNGTRINTPGITNAPDGAQIWTLDLESLVKINATKTGSGTVSPSGITLVPYQGNTNFNITASSPSNRIESISTNGVAAYTNSTGDNSMTYTNFPWNNVTKDSNTLSVVFGPKKYNLEIQDAGAGRYETNTMSHGSTTNIVLPQYIYPSSGRRDGVWAIEAKDVNVSTNSP